MRTVYQGVVVPLVTPLDGEGAVCTASVARLVGSVRDHVTALMPALSSGEGWKLSEAHWEAVVAATVASADGLPVLAGVQRPTTDEVTARVWLAKELGVTAVVVPPPAAGEVSQRQVYEHYRAVLEVGLPVVVYNEAAISGVHLELETLTRICRLPGVVAVKESSGSPDFTRELLAADTGVAIFEGWENLLYESRGVAGFVGPLANLEPALCAEMLARPSPGLQHQINLTCEQYGIFLPDWYRAVKEELCRRGVIETAKIVEGVE